MYFVGQYVYVLTVIGDNDKGINAKTARIVELGNGKDILVCMVITGNPFWIDASAVAPIKNLRELVKITKYVEDEHEFYLGAKK